MTLAARRRCWSSRAFRRPSLHHPCRPWRGGKTPRPLVARTSRSVAHGAFAGRRAHVGALKPSLSDWPALVHRIQPAGVDVEPRLSIVPTTARTSITTAAEIAEDLLRRCRPPTSATAEGLRGAVRHLALLRSRGTAVICLGAPMPQGTLVLSETTRVVRTLRSPRRLPLRSSWPRRDRAKSAVSSRLNDRSACYRRVAHCVAQLPADICGVVELELRAVSTTNSACSNGCRCSSAV